MKMCRKVSLLQNISTSANKTTLPKLITNSLTHIIHTCRDIIRAGVKKLRTGFDDRWKDNDNDNGRAPGLWHFAGFCITFTREARLFCAASAWFVSENFRIYDSKLGRRLGIIHVHAFKVDNNTTPTAASDNLRSFSSCVVSATKTKLPSRVIRRSNHKPIILFLSFSLFSFIIAQLFADSCKL